MKKVIVFIMSIFTTTIVIAQNQVDCNFTSISSNITSNTTLSAATLYRVEGCVHVTNGHTLTIPAGTTVMFKKASASSLTIDEGASLVVNGSSGSPVVFTSDQTPTHKDYGDWDGLIIAGQASNNVSGGSISLSGRTCTSVSGGGSTDADNSGTIEYLRIEYANYGVTFLSVGSGTTVDHIQTAYIANNAYEFLGGTVDAKYLASYNAKGNDFVFNFGNRSLLQNLLSVRLDAAAHLASGSSAIVVSNDNSGSSNTPLTTPVITNVDLIGPYACGATGLSSDFRYGVLFQNNAAGYVYNMVEDGWYDGVFISGNNTINNVLVSKIINVAYSSFINNGNLDYDKSGTWSSTCASSITNWMTHVGTCSMPGNQFGSFTTGFSSTICGNYATTPPSFVLGTNTLSAPNYTPDPLDNAFFDNPAKRGALNTSTDWTSSWSNWDPQDFNPCRQGKMNNPMGISNPANRDLDGLKLAPNPGNTVTYAMFNSTLNGNVSVSVVDNAGRVLRTTQNNVTKGNQRIAVDTKGLAAGIYIIKVQSSNALMHAQLVIE